MKILNLYAGIGGNRKLWGNEHEVTAVENVDYIADVYAKLFPQDTLVLGDAHQYLLDHYKQFDFIWSSPPCPTHSKTNTFLNPQGIIRYPDMGLYQEIIFLRQWGGYDGHKWVVENVEPYYKPLINPTTSFDRHFFWSNFPIPIIKTGRQYNIARATEAELVAEFDINIKTTRQNRKLLRNVVHPLIGEHILRAAMKAEPKQTALL